MIEADTIDRLVRLKPDGPPVLSLYVNVDASDWRRLDSQMNSLIEQVRPLATDESLDREARLSVREDIRRVELAFGEQRWNPGGISIFSSSGRDFYEEVALPRGVHDRVVVDSTPWIRPLLAILDEYHRACVVMIGKGEARMWELYQNDMRELTEFHDETLRKPNYAVWRAEDRIHNRQNELAKRHYRRTAEILERVYRSRGFDVLVICGRDYEVPSFVEFLPRDLRTRVAGTFTIDDSALLGDIKAEAQAVLDRYERAEETGMVADTFDLSGMGGLAAVGMSDCLWAGTVSGVQTLLVQEGAVVPGVVCDQSGWLGQSGETCPVCGNQTRHVPDIIDEMVTSVIDDGGSIEHVQAETELADHLVAARLRFPLPPRP